MNPTNIIAVLSLLETIATQIAGAVSAIKAAQSAGTDLTDAQVATYRDAANAALAQLDADIKGAAGAPTGTPPQGSGG